MPEETITLACPARAEYLRLVRLATADLGARAGMNVEEIDDLKIAASEACGMLLGGDEPIALTFVVGEACVAVEGWAGAGRLAAETEFSRHLLEAVVDEHHLIEADGDGRAGFRFVKRHHP